METRREELIEAISSPQSYVCNHVLQMQIRIVDGLDDGEVIELLRACTSVLAARINGLDNPLIALVALLEDSPSRQDQFYAAALDVAKAHYESVVEGVKDAPTDS